MRHKIGWIQYAVKSDWLKMAFFFFLSKYNDGVELPTWAKKKINFTKFFFQILLLFGYFKPQWIYGTAHKIPIVKWHSANEHIRWIGHTGKNRFTIFWHNFVRDQSKKKFGTPPVPTPHQFFPVMLLFLYKCLEAVCHMLYLYEIEEEIFFDDSNETHSILTDEKPCGRSLSSSFYF